MSILSPHSADAPPPRSPRFGDRSGAWLALLVTVCLMLIAACGTRLPDETIVKAASLGGSTAEVATSPAAAATVDTGAPSVATGAAASGAASATSIDTPAGKPLPGASDAARRSSAATTGTSATPARNSPAAPAATTVPARATLTEVKIGTLGSFSGVLGAVTEGAPKTLSAWAAYTTAHGGLNGHPVKVVVADDQADPATALTMARRLVEVDKVLAFVGNINVFGFDQVEKYAREKNVPLIGGDALLPGWFTSTNTFPVSAPVSMQIIKGLQYLVDKGVRKIGIMYCLEVAALCSYLNDQVAKSEVGKYVSQSYQVSLVAPSYTSQCLRMKADGIDLIYLMMDTAGAARVARDCATQGFTPKTMLLGVDATNELPGIPALADALLPAGTVSPQAHDVPAIEQFRQIMATYAPSAGESGFGALAWAAGELFGVAAKDLSPNPTSAELYEALWKIKDNTLGGLSVPLTFTKGKPASPKPCVFIWGTANGKYTAPLGAKPLC